MLAVELRWQNASAEHADLRGSVTTAPSGPIAPVARDRRGEDRPGRMEQARAESDRPATRGEQIRLPGTRTRQCVIPHQDADRGENFLSFSAMRCPQTSFYPELGGDRRTATSVRYPSFRRFLMVDPGLVVAGDTLANLADDAQRRPRSAATTRYGIPAPLDHQPSPTVLPKEPAAGSGADVVKGDTVRFSTALYAGASRRDVGDHRVLAPPQSRATTHPLHLRRQAPPLFRRRPARNRRRRQPAHRHTHPACPTHPPTPTPAIPLTPSSFSRPHRDFSRQPLALCP
jgi:hypothetical protein